MPVRAAKVEKPLPYLFICSFIANAASFVLPISNPANLVIYGNHILPLFTWLPQYIIRSVVSIVVTYILLFLTQRKELKGTIDTHLDIPELSLGGKVALYGILNTAVILLASSTLDIQLGLPIAVTGIATTGIVILSAKKSPLEVIKGVSWSVQPLVAGLFVIVEALNKLASRKN